MATVRKLTPRPSFKVGDRVTWTDAGRTFTGTVRNVHKLGGYGFAFGVEPDADPGPCAEVEVEEWALARLGILDRMAEAADESVRKPGRRNE